MRNLTIDINAPSYEEQEQQIFDRLKRFFMAFDFESEYYYYNNALQEVKKLSIMKDKDDRIITKGEFISRINKKDFLFNTWFIKKKGIDKYCKAIKKQFFSEYNVSPYERFFLIDCNESIPETELKMLVQNISKKWSKLSRRLQDTFCPYVYFHNISNGKLKKIKELLQLDGFYFLDGYDFKDSDFFVKSICKKATSYNEIKLKIISNIEQIDDILDSLSVTREIYQFFTKKSFYENTVHRHIKIPIVETKDINAII
jgi:hypothetical protein